MFLLSHKSAARGAIRSSLKDPAKIRDAIEKTRTLCQRENFTAAFRVYLEATIDTEGEGIGAKYLLYKNLLIEGMRAIQGLNLVERTDEQAFEDVLGIVLQILMAANLAHRMNFMQFDGLAKWQLFKIAPDGVTEEQMVEFERKLAPYLDSAR